MMTARRKQLRLSLLIGICLGWCPFVARAATVVYGSVYTGQNSLASLYTIDPTTGAATLVGSVGGIGFKDVSAMDFDPATGILYGEGSRVSDSERVLITINTATGVGTEIGSTTLGTALFDMSFRSDGTLFGTAFLSGSTYIVTLSPITGQATAVVGDTLVGNTQGNALAFSLSDTLYYANASVLGTVNQSTGEVTNVASADYSPLSSTPRASGMDFDPTTGDLWAAVKNGTGGGATTYFSVIDTSTGESTIIGQSANGLDAIAVQPILEVPEVSRAALLLLGGAALALRRRRNR